MIIESKGYSEICEPGKTSVSAREGVLIHLVNHEMGGKPVIKTRWGRSRIRGGIHHGSVEHVGGILRLAYNGGSKDSKARLLQITHEFLEQG